MTTGISGASRLVLEDVVVRFHFWPCTASLMPRPIKTRHVMRFARLSADEVMRSEHILILHQKARACHQR